MNSKIYNPQFHASFLLFLISLPILSSSSSLSSLHSYPSPPDPPSPLPEKIIISAVGTTTFVVAGAFFLCLTCFRPQRRQETGSGADRSDRRKKPLAPAMFESGGRFEVDFKDLIVDEDGLDVLYWKKLKNIKGSIHQEPPRVRANNRDADRSSRSGSSSSSRGQLLSGQRSSGRSSGVDLQVATESGGGVGDSKSPAVLGGRSSSSRSLNRSRRLDSQSSDVALQSAANYGGGVGGEVGDWNSPAVVGGRSSSSHGQMLPGQRFDGRSSGVALQASANSGGGVVGEVGNWNFPAVVGGSSSSSSHGQMLPGQRFDGRSSEFALQASAYSGGGVQLPPGYQPSFPPPALYSAAVSTAAAPPPPPAPAPPPPPPPAPAKKAPPPPPPPAPAKKAPPPPPPPGPGKKAPPPPPGPKGKGGSSSLKPPAAPKQEAEDKEGGKDQVMLKPLHWEKLNVNPEHSMVWDKIHKGSFQYSEDTMEALFGFAPANRKSGSEDNPNSKTSEASNPNNPNIKVFILDPRKSRNTAIVLKSLGTPRSELIDSLLEGRGLSVETLEKLARTVPTREEESEILAYDGDPAKLADAESFLYNLLKAVPLAYTRASTMLFKLNYKTEIINVKESLQPMEPACNELRSHGLFLKLLEAILKAGNRLNAGTARGGAKAFNLTTLLKLSDFKSSDGKTTLLSFVVHEVIRNEGRRAVLSLKKDTDSAPQQPDDPVGKEEKEKELLRLGLPVVSGLSSEFLNVKKAASMDYDSLQSTLGSLKYRLDETRQLVSKCKASGGSGGFLKEMEQFLESAEVEMKALQDEHTRVIDLVKKTTQYYQAGSTNKNPLQLFIIVKDFLGMVDRTCADIARTLQPKKTAAAGATSGASSTQQDILRTRVAFPGLKEQILLVNKSKLSDDSSDSEDDF